METCSFGLEMRNLTKSVQKRWRTRPPKIVIATEDITRLVISIKAKIKTCAGEGSLCCKFCLWDAFGHYEESFFRTKGEALAAVSLLQKKLGKEDISATPYEYIWQIFLEVSWSGHEAEFYDC